MRNWSLIIGPASPGRRIARWSFNRTVGRKRRINAARERAIETNLKWIRALSSVSLDEWHADASFRQNKNSNGQQDDSTA